MASVTARNAEHASAGSESKLRDGEVDFGTRLLGCDGRAPEVERDASKKRLVPMRWHEGVLLFAWKTVRTDARVRGEKPRREQKRVVSGWRCSQARTECSIRHSRVSTLLPLRRAGHGARRRAGTGRRGRAPACGCG